MQWLQAQADKNMKELLKELTEEAPGSMSKCGDKGKSAKGKKN